MDWRLNLMFLLVVMPIVHSWSPIPSAQRRSFFEYQIHQQQEQQQHQQQQQQQQQQQRQYQQQRNTISPYLDLALCPLRQQPWSCARQQSARLLDIWDGELHVQWQKLKDEADSQLNATLERRGYSDTTTLSKEKPSTILKKIAIGTNYMKKYLAETMDGFLGREYDYTKNEEENEVDEYEEEAEEDQDEDGDDEETNDLNDEQTGGLKSSSIIDENSNDLAHNNNNHDSDVEFVEIDDTNNADVDDDGDDDDDEETDEAIDELKRPGGGNKRRKKKKKKGNQQEIATQAANLLLIQPLDQQLASHHHGDEFEAHGATTQLLKPVAQKFKPLKPKKRKRKKGNGSGGGGGGHGHGHGGAASTIVVEQEPATDHFGLGLLEELIELDGDVGGKRKKKYPMKYGRSIGVTRGKKKKKKKAIMKLMLLGTFLKAKIELLLKLLGAHLQIKFFAVAFISLLINVARFWIDLKRGGPPQKVVFVEHAHHQHHYEDNGEDWNESAGGYWKRSLQTDSTENTYDSVTDSYQPRQPHNMQIQQQHAQQQYDPQYLAYQNQWQRK